MSHFKILLSLEIPIRSEDNQVFIFDGDPNSPILYYVADLVSLIWKWLKTFSLNY